MKHDNSEQSSPAQSEEQGEDVEPISYDRDSDSGQENENAQTPGNEEAAQPDPEVDMSYSAPIDPAGDPEDSEETEVAQSEETIAAGDESTPPGEEDPAHDTDDIVDNGTEDSNVDEPQIADSDTPVSGDENQQEDTADTDDDDEDDVDTITIVEALIFASDEPLTFKQIKDVIESSGAMPAASDEDEDEDDESTSDSKDTETESGDAENDESEADVAVQPPSSRRKKEAKLTIGKVRKWVEGINNAYDESGRPFRIVEVAGGFSFQTISAYGQYVGRLYTERSKRRLTQAALETLAIVAYKQPISKPAVESIRGVSADYVLKSLLEKNLVAIVGREDTVGRPLLYGTTKQFLKHFGLHSLNDLPKPREIEELLKESEEELAPPIEINADQLPHPHHFDEPSIFDDVEREYGPEAEGDSTENGIQQLAEVLNGTSEQPPMQPDDDASDAVGSDTEAVTEQADTDDANEDDTPSGATEQTDDMENTDEYEESENEHENENDQDVKEDNTLAASDEDAAHDEQTPDSAENSGQDENLPDVDIADEDTEKE